MNKERPPALLGELAPLRFALLTAATPTRPAPSAPASARRLLSKQNHGNTDTKMLNQWCHSTVRQRITVWPNLTVSFCHEATRRRRSG